MRREGVHWSLYKLNTLQKADLFSDQMIHSSCGDAWSCFSTSDSESLLRMNKTQGPSSLDSDRGSPVFLFVQVQLAFGHIFSITGSREWIQLYESEERTDNEGSVQV